MKERKRKTERGWERREKREMSSEFYGYLKLI